MDTGVIFISGSGFQDALSLLQMTALQWVPIKQTPSATVRADKVFATAKVVDGLVQNPNLLSPSILTYHLSKNALRGIQSGSNASRKSIFSTSETGVKRDVSAGLYR